MRGGQHSLPRCLALRAWLAILVLALANDALRESWHELLAACTFRDGKLWPLLLAVIVVAPVLACRLRGRP